MIFKCDFFFLRSEQKKTNYLYVFTVCKIYNDKNEKLFIRSIKKKL